ncbi:hypothetical protein B296_00031666, partial [Ensete ventricosum]
MSSARLLSSHLIGRELSSRGLRQPWRVSRHGIDFRWHLFVAVLVLLFLPAAVVIATSTEWGIRSHAAGTATRDRQNGRRCHRCRQAGRRILRCDWALFGSDVIIIIYYYYHFLLGKESMKEMTLSSIITLN